MQLPPKIIAAQLDEYRAQFEAGTRDALMHALLFCATHQVVMPAWVDRELHVAWHRFVRRDVDDLGEAFDIVWPKGSHKAAYQKRRRLQYAVFHRVHDRHMRGEAIEPELFERVGEELGVGKRLASEYYYGVRDGLLPGKSQTSGKDFSVEQSAPLRPNTRGTEPQRRRNGKKGTQRRRTSKSR